VCVVGVMANGSLAEVANGSLAEVRMVCVVLACGTCSFIQDVVLADGITQKTSYGIRCVGTGTGLSKVLWAEQPHRLCPHAMPPPPTLHFRDKRGCSTRMSSFMRPTPMLFVSSVHNN
jgi:hypothetical protein